MQRYAYESSARTYVERVNFREESQDVAALKP